MPNNTQNNQGSQNQPNVRQAGAGVQNEEHKNPYITTPQETATKQAGAAKEGSRIRQPEGLNELDEEQDARGMKAKSSEDYGANAGRSERGLQAGSKNVAEE